MSAVLANVSLERMVRAVEKVRDRLLRASAALEAAGVPYAVVGGNAVAAWVSRVDESAVRNTQDVDVLLRRPDLDAAKTALFNAGFIHRRIDSLGRAESLEVFLDGPQAKARDAVHIIFAEEKVRPDSLAASPSISESEAADHFRLITLEAWVQMKLISFRDKARMHLRDLLEVGLIDESWCARLPEALSLRLKQILENPEG